MCEISKAFMPPKMGLRVSSCFHNAFSAVDCQEISGRFWPVSDGLAFGRRYAWPCIGPDPLLDC